jgi:hypothetical protein
MRDCISRRTDDETAAAHQVRRTHKKKHKRVSDVKVTAGPLEFAAR